MKMSYDDPKLFNNLKPNLAGLLCATTLTVSCMFGAYESGTSYFREEQRLEDELKEKIEQVVAPDRDEHRDEIKNGRTLISIIHSARGYLDESSYVQGFFSPVIKKQPPQVKPAEKYVLGALRYIEDHLEETENMLKAKNLLKSVHEELFPYSRIPLGRTFASSCSFDDAPDSLITNKYMLGKLEEAKHYVLEQERIYTQPLNDYDEKIRSLRRERYTSSSDLLRFIFFTILSVIGFGGTMELAEEIYKKRSPGHLNKTKI